MTGSRTISRLSRGLALAAGAGVLAVAGSGCGGEVKADNPQDTAAAESFNQHCSGCHSLKLANAYGSKPEGQLEGGERTNGPNFTQRKEDRDDVLYAIRNGGFSGAIMPANIVTGKEAERLADYVGKYSGREPGQ
ncbi:MAG: c-type cytochrome [Thermoleophilaceae bacterium]